MGNSIKEEVYKCSKCGLCQSVCPIYIATKNEMYLERGRCIILNNYFNNEKKLSSKFIKELDICLNCNACSDFCPSSIDAEEIFTQVKYKFNYRYSILPFYIIFKLQLLIHKLKSYIFKNDELYKCRINREKTIIKSNEEQNIVYFQGCINKYINPTDKNASLNIIEQLGYNITFISNDCCGLPILSDGKLDEFNKNSDKIIKSIPENVKYIVCSCDSCFKTLKKALYGSKFSSKIITLDELLKLNYIQLPVSRNTLYYKPYSRKQDSSLFNNFQPITKKGHCSLMENFFILKHKKLALKLLNSIFYTKEETDNKNIITSCRLAQFGLKKGFEITGSNTKVMSYAEYLSYFE